MNRSWIGRLLVERPEQRTAEQARAQAVRQVQADLETFKRLVAEAAGLPKPKRNGRLRAVEHATG